MVLLDSNIIIYLSKDMLLADDVFNEDTIYTISIITYMEVLGYEFKSKNEELFVQSIFKNMKLLEIDTNIANQVIKIRKKYKIRLPDAIISATAIEYNALLITNDVRLKKIKKLKIKLLEI